MRQSITGDQQGACMLTLSDETRCLIKCDKFLGSISLNKEQQSCHWKMSEQTEHLTVLVRMREDLPEILKWRFTVSKTEIWKCRNHFRQKRITCGHENLGFSGNSKKGTTWEITIMGRHVGNMRLKSRLGPNYSNIIVISRLFQILNSISHQSTWISSLNSQHPCRLVTFLLPFYRWETEAQRELNTLPRVTHSFRKNGFQLRVNKAPKLYLFFRPC